MVTPRNLKSAIIRELNDRIARVGGAAVVCVQGEEQGAKHTCEKTIYCEILQLNVVKSWQNVTV